MSNSADNIEFPDVFSPVGGRDGSQQDRPPLAAPIPPMMPPPPPPQESEESTRSEATELDPINEDNRTFDARDGESSQAPVDSDNVVGETHVQKIAPTADAQLSRNDDTVFLGSTLAESVEPGQSSRTDFPLLPTKVALLVIDIQEYLSQPNSVHEEEQGQYFYRTSLPRTISNLERLLNQFRKQRDSQSQGCEVIFTFLQALTRDCRDVSLDYKLSGPKLATIPNSPVAPATFLDRVEPRPMNGKGDLLLPKTSCSVFLSTNLHYVLQNLHIEQLVICGQLTDQCVESAVRDAADLGYFVTVVDDACAAQSEAAHQKGLSGMKGFSRILTSQCVLDELQKPRPVQAVRTVRPPAPLAEEKLATGTVSASPKPHISILPVTEWTPPRSSDNAVATAMGRTLRVAGVQFLRYMTVDPFNSIRCKAVPLDFLSQNSRDWNHQVCVAQVCFGGLPPFGDFMMETETGLNAEDVLTIRPDLSTLRILPYAPKTAVVLGTAHDSSHGTVSPLCTRALLARVSETARQHNISFNVGAELEFCLHDAKTGKPVDQSLFANATTLNDQEAFIMDLYSQLRLQEISVSQIHAESAPGQLEVVLEYRDDPVALADAVVWTRSTITAVAHSHAMKALFLPKVHAQQAGNGLHLHLSFRHLDMPKTKNSFPHGNLDGEMSQDAKSFIEGILIHLPALLALTLPTRNSFRRVGPGCWTGHEAGWAVEDKEMPLRVCREGRQALLSNVEYKLCDSMANIYLALAGVLACGLNGIVQKAYLRPPGKNQLSLPSSIDESLECLKGSEFLMELLGPSLSRAYVACRQAEASHFSAWSLEEEVAYALERS